MNMSRSSLDPKAGLIDVATSFLNKTISKRFLRSIFFVLGLASFSGLAKGDGDLAVC